jgi:hypothetical protein
VGIRSRCRLHLSAKLSEAILAYRFYWIENAPASALPVVRLRRTGLASELQSNGYKYLTFRIPLKRDCSLLQGASNGSSRPRLIIHCIIVAAGSVRPCRFLKILAIRNERGSQICLSQQKDESIPGLKQNGL